MRLTAKLSLVLSALAVAVLASAVLPPCWAEEGHLLEQRDARQLAELQ